MPVDPNPPRASLLDGLGALLVMGAVLAAIGAVAIPGMLGTYAIASCISLAAGLAARGLSKRKTAPPSASAADRAR